MEGGERRFKVPESVLVVIHTAAGEVLLMERADAPGYWQSVTGSKDSAEEPLVETCRREVFEETGIVVDAAAVDAAGAEPDGRSAASHAICLRDWQMENVYEIYPRWRHRYAPGVSRNTEHVFGLRVPRTIPLRLEPREHLRFEWLEWRAAAERCFSPSNAAAILRLPELMS